MRRTLAALLLAVTALTGTATAAFADKPVDIIVEDTAGVLDKNTLIPAVKDIDFYEPTTVAVYTRAGAYEDNFNEEVLTYARAEHPEWLSADGQKWADGLYLFALDPVGRQVGTYMGEDRKVDLADRTAIQESTYDFLRDAQWTDGTIKGIESGAEIINRPWYKSPAFLGTMAFLGLGCAAGFITRLVVRARNLRLAREAIRKGDASYSSVTADLDVTELNANTIPSGSAYGARVLEKYRVFGDSYSQATTLSNTVHAFTDKEMKKGRNRKKAEEYERIAVQLDGDDDLIADTNSLLNLAPGWESAWDRQVAPFRKDLEEVDNVVSFPGAPGTANALAAFRDAASRNLSDWAENLGRRAITPESALDRLRDARQQLSELLRQHAYAVSDAYAKTQEEARMMRRAMDDSFMRPSRRSNGILDTAYPGTVFISAGSFNHGYSAGRSSVSSARQAAAAASRPSTGYGSSGGSFSGSGSSSRF
ncbi:DUF5129 domain-containing protein [Arthrobacter sp. zg-Y1110]|uniref:DUF5129 domain-containing protein n=1 Tax=Arthrobacter sp. zg-Y1110 TaxID=2886932 RepID=UPI001D13ACB4|nr:DUF5129 domain-containing protein [Arthrobacter sp. zg-Y1110]MCC3292530.1 DUF5129 domain-containing protein [Arthrobacter sp. zg-Y1110]UWX87038.1 DUF5129 domain-containing protein [Arthrobacter sp. zg-Y1110]